MIREGIGMAGPSWKEAVMSSYSAKIRTGWLKRFLQLLDISDCIATIDAIGTQA
jgi:hypothetical protein